MRYIKCVRYTEFEWDEEKNAINIEKHGVSFRLAARVFEDEYRLERYDLSEGNDFEEDRIQTIGCVQKVLFVVYTERNSRCRIISARKANPKERRMYYGNGDLQTEGWRRFD